MKFKKGDKVEVINWGSHYSSNDDMARRLGLKKWKEGGGWFEDRKYGHGGKFGVVQGEKEHHVGVRIGGIDYILGSEGLKLINKNMKKNKKSKEKAIYKVGDKVFNSHNSQRSIVLGVNWDEEGQMFKYTLQCLDDSGSIHLIWEESIDEIEVVKMTVEELKEYYQENESTEVVIVKK